MRIYITLILIISMVLLDGCVERIDLFTGNAATLVVDGTISDEEGPHVIKIYLSESFSEIRDYTKVEGAKVVIVDDLDVKENLFYTGDGKYQTSDSFQGIVGRSYMLTIELSSGQRYESSFEKIEPVGEIDKMNYVIEDEEIVFNIDFDDNGVDKNFYRWRYLGTYQVFAPESSNSDYSPEGGGGGGGVRGGANCIVFGTRSKNCWAKDFDIGYLNVSDDRLFNGTTSSSFEIYRREKEDVKFAIGYSALVKQYSISEKAFDFWSSIDTQLSNNGSIFDTDNFLITGNVKNVDNPSIPVLGYFGASAVSSKRIFIDNEALSYEHIYHCTPADPESCIPQACIDCKKHSGSSVTEKPDFWL